MVNLTSWGPRVNWHNLCEEQRCGLQVCVPRLACGNPNPHCE